MPTRHQPTLGILLILAAGLLLASQDALSKSLTAVYPLLLVVWLRYLSQSVLMLALFAPRMGLNLLRTQRPWLQFVRGLSLVAITLLFYSALRFIPLGEATAVIFLAPLVVIVLSATWLKEHISRGLWLSVGVGLLGVLLIVRPGFVIGRMTAGMDPAPLSSTPAQVAAATARKCAAMPCGIGLL